MLQEEFEELAGYHVNTDVYHNIIEPMYMAVERSKKDFVKMLNPEAFAIETLWIIVRKDLTLPFPEWEYIQKINGYSSDHALDRYLTQFWGENRPDIKWKYRAVSPAEWVYSIRRSNKCKHE